MILWLLAALLPLSEYVMYQTCERGRLDTLEAYLSKDSAGYHVHYVSDRVVDVILDSTTLQTRYVKKVIKGETNVEIINDREYRVTYLGRVRRYANDELIYDRHTLDFAFRGLELNAGFRRRIRLSIPEFRIVNADLEVIGADTLITPAGVFACWKLQMTPRILFLKRDFFFWFEQAYPHRMIKLSDSSDKNKMILVKYQSPSE